MARRLSCLDDPTDKYYPAYLDLAHCKDWTSNDLFTSQDKQVVSTRQNVPATISVCKQYLDAIVSDGWSRFSPARVTKSANPNIVQYWKKWWGDLGKTYKWSQVDELRTLELVLLHEVS